MEQRGRDELYRRACREQGIPQEDMGLPMLLTPAGAAVGQEEISARMRELVHESCGMAGAVWYYQRPDCMDCQSPQIMIPFLTLGGLKKPTPV